MARVQRQPNRLVGREQERAELLALLDDSDCCLITITGPGGIGKTRLALEVAAASDRTVAVVEYATIADPDLFLARIADALGTETRIGIDVRATLEERLRSGPHLLALDNLEHLAGIGRDVAWLIGLDADLRILATSRAPLQVRGEHEFALAPLESDRGAVDLFIERAAEAKRGFAVDDATRATIGRICERLDGIPLAIELAAARMKVVTPAVLEAMLDSRLAVLTSSQADRPDRHRTMHNAIAWSFDLLNPSQQDLFARISVFEAGFTLREATELAGEGADSASSFRTLDLLSGLVDASLLLAAQDDGEPRFRMLETVREFGQAQLRARPDADRIREWHAETFRRLAAAARPALRGAERTLWLDRLDAAQANLRSALRWYGDRGETERALGLAGDMWQYWWWRSHLIEGRRALEGAVALPGAEDYPSALARCLTGLGALTETQGRYADAETFHRRAEQLLEESGDTRELAESCLFRWLVSFNAEDQEGMTAWASRSLHLYRELDDPWGVAMSLMEQGVMAMRQREHERAIALLTESERIFDAIGDGWGVAICQGVHSNVETDRRAYARAAELQRASLTGLLSLNDLWGVATVLPAAARLAAELGQIEVAVRLSGAISALHGQIGAPLKVPFRERFEATLSGARTALGRERFEALWSEGSALGADAAVELAISMPVSQAGGESGHRGAEPAVALSPREREVLRLVPGNSARAIGEQLFISESTVRTHIDNILSKYGARTQKELIAMVFGHGAT